MLQKIIDRFKFTFAVKSSIDELSSLSDRELKDIGINRSMIPYLATRLNKDKHLINANMKGWA